MFRFAGAVAIIGIAALGVYGGAMLLFPSLLPTLAGLGVTSDVPATINHQGVVMVNGTRFNGSGSFKFAIVDPDTGNNVWTNSVDTAPADGVPDTGVPVMVTDGVYSVKLGASPMAAITRSIFADGNLRLRVWFDGGTNYWQQLSPDQDLTSVPYAFNVADGAISAAKLQDGAVTAAKLGDSTVTSAKIVAGTVVDNHISATAGISGSKLADSTVSIAKLDPGMDGWLPANETWVYASASSFTVIGNVAAKYATGTKLHLVQGATIKYFYALKATYNNPATAVQVTAGTDYTLANAAITNNSRSLIASPQGFPSRFNYAPGVGPEAGQVYSWTSITGQFKLVDSTAIVWMQIVIGNNGTGGGSALIASVPFTALTMAPLRGHNVTWGLGLTGHIGGNQAIIRRFDNVYPGGSDYNLVVEATYEIAP